MTKQRVIADTSMSLDGFIADENDGVEELFGGYGNGDVEVPTAEARWTFRVTEAPVRLGGPVVTEGKAVTHLTYEVLR